MFVDTHTHIYDEAFRGEEESFVRRALDAKVCKMLQADVDSKERERMFRWTEAYPGVLFPMLGLYPGSVDKNWREEIDKMLDYKQRGIVALGEIGLDYHWSKEFKKEQQEALRIQLELASQMDLPVNIHLRDATEDFVDIIEDCRHLNLRGNLHAFSCSFEIWQRLCKSGEWYVGIGGVVTYRKATLPETVARIPLDRILLETDAPYLTPVPHRGERNESSYIPLIAAKIAEIKGISIEEVANATTANAEILFKI